MSSVVGVPVSVLATGGGVEVEDSVDSVARADLNDSVEVLEARSLQDTGVHVICPLSDDMLRSTAEILPSK